MERMQSIVMLLSITCAGMIMIGCATGGRVESWSHAESVLLSTALALHGSDWMQTRDGITERSMKEGNVILGHSPGGEQIDLYFASTAAGMSLLSVYSNKKMRRAILIGWCFMEFVCVMHNNSQGLQVSVPM